MRPTITAFRDALPGLSDPDISDFIGRLPDRYFEFFDFQTQCDHLVKLTALSSEGPISLTFRQNGDDRIDCTIVTYNYPFLFSLITGVLSSNGVEIISGEIFTYSTAPVEMTGKPTVLLDRRHLATAVKRRKVVDFFSVKLIRNLSFRKWALEVTEELGIVTQLLETGADTAVRDASEVVNRRAATAIRDLAGRSSQFLSPVQVDFDNSRPDVTQLTLITENTPFFLYSFSTALAHHEISIDHLTISTIGNQVRDTFALTDSHGKKLESPALLDQLRLSVLLCKQFTYFLDRAPNPFDAISRFEQLVTSILTLPEKGQWIDLLSNPLALRDMARLLGTSDYLWEDVIRLHYESLLPLLGPESSQAPVYTGESTIQQRLDAELATASTLAEQKQVLNQFKDHETFLIDLSHILEQTDILKLSKQLTLLVEAVVGTAVRLVMAHLIAQHGTPMTVGAIPAQYAAFGLGKLGGAALGYASDIELLIIYSDNGETDGPSPMSNADFFSELVRELRQFIVSKRSGIFDIDLRLRPYGNDGPLAVSVENFCRYFGPGGPAHIYEKLALVRLRHISGNRQLGARIEKLRDEFVYGTENFDFSELWQLRKKQYQEKASSRLNAKFSPGALVDIEYTVQALQIMLGRRFKSLRTPRIREALTALRKAGILEAEETSQIIVAYIFLRRLTNGLRILRGSAEDLFLPDVTSSEYDHLARRMGYQDSDVLTAAAQLHMEFDAVTATARTFLQAHFSRQSLPSQSFANVADIVLNPTMPSDLKEQILRDSGFHDPTRAEVNLLRLASVDRSPAHFSRLVVLACEWLRHKPDPDMALNNWERFVAQLADPAAHFELLLSQPIRLDILLDVFSVSQFLSDTLIRNPDFFAAMTQKGYLDHRFLRGSAADELKESARQAHSVRDWRNRLRLFKRRELLRIAIKDITLQNAMPKIYRDISLVAEAAIQACVDFAFQKWPNDPHGLANRFCMMAMGKLGATELNYSSDIDLIPIVDLEGIPESALPEVTTAIESILRQVNADLSEFTDEGQCYRMDYTLRPFGASGQWVTSVSGLTAYYAQSASKWEIQALLKMRPVAGNWAIGFAVLDALKARGLARFPAKELVSTIRELRVAAIRKSARRLGGGIDIKNGAGGIRDIEFWVQGLQLTHLDQFPQLWIRRTLAALDQLRACGIVSDTLAYEIREVYLLFRRLEHFLQVLDDQQTHTLPANDAELSVLAKRLLGSQGTGAELLAMVDQFRQRVSALQT